MAATALPRSMAAPPPTARTKSPCRIPRRRILVGDAVDVVDLGLARERLEFDRLDGLLAERIVNLPEDPAAGERPRAAEDPRPAAELPAQFTDLTPSTPAEYNLPGARKS